MDKRYQVFVSSTYVDLKDERRRVIQTLMEMDCIPAGMELFPAADEEQWQFIKKVIDDCDYYILIIGGRYGSTTKEGISYTEMEYDYAIEQDLKVLAFPHENLDEIPPEKSDLDPDLKDRLAAFRDKVTNGRLVKTWKDASDLPGLVALSLSKTIKTYPAIGWVRANQVSNTELLQELNELRKVNESLEKFRQEILEQDKNSVENIAELDESITMSGTHWYNDRKSSWKVDLTWREIFALIGPYLLQPLNDETVKRNLGSSIHESVDIKGRNPELNDQEFQTIKIQFMSLGLISVESHQTVRGSMGLFWVLTQKGNKLLVQTRTVKSTKGNAIFFPQLRLSKSTTE
jgi:hypothetical protein